MPKPRHGGHLEFMQIKNSPHGFLSGNQAKFVPHIHVTAKPSKNNTLLMTARYSIWQLDYNMLSDIPQLQQTLFI